MDAGDTDEAEVGGDVLGCFDGCRATGDGGVLEDPAVEESQESAGLRVKVRWVTPLGVETASMS